MILKWNLKIRSTKPYIYNIETTNYCNMKCDMCPRTMYMTRKNIWIDNDMFKGLIKKVKVHDQNNIEEFWNWLNKTTQYNNNEVSENGFYFSIVSRHLVLHGFGEPFLDKNLIERIQFVLKVEFQPYFSCTLPL